MDIVSQSGQQTRPATRHILCVVGTRPEAIKMAPVILALKAQPWAKVTILATAQHRELLDSALAVFGLHPDVDLDVMQVNQGLSALTARLIEGLDSKLTAIKPDAVLAQGDTTTVLASAMVCFYHHIPFGHVEAGLRTFDFSKPFPEEMNRVLTSRITRWHFAPTTSARGFLHQEGVRDDTVTVCGNTVIDALMWVCKALDDGEVKPNFQIDLPAGTKLVLVTAHRRENFGAPLERICQAICQIADARDDVHFLFAAHPNPSVRAATNVILANQQRVTVCDPLSYVDFISAMRRCHFILSDSGGVQEEAPALGKPVLVLREDTERPEAVDLGVTKVVGSDIDLIVSSALELLDNPKAYKAMAQGISPYGDGHATDKILRVLKRDLAP
jgi:UDP-N-acetylglucosamine 2-epimerase (non-hydrolysing)